MLDQGQLPPGGKQQRAGWRKAKNACSWWAANSKERRQKLNKAFPVFLLELINAMMVFLRRSKQWGREEPEESYVHMKSKFRNAGGPFPKHPSIQLSSHCVALLPCIRHWAKCEDNLRWDFCEFYILTVIQGNAFSNITLYSNHPRIRFWFWKSGEGPEIPVLRCFQGHHTLSTKGMGSLR